MADGIGDPIPGRRRFESHEVALITLGLGTSFALLAAANHQFSAVLFEVLGATMSYAIVLLLCRIKTARFNQKISFIASFAFSLWFYCLIAQITPALGTKLRDSTLLALDKEMFGQTPAIYCERISRPWITELMSLCYIFYHLYLAVVVADAVAVSPIPSSRLARHLFLGFAIGFAGYLLIPAVGPDRAFPELFRGPLPSGTLSRRIGEAVAKGSSVYDTFPSLHVWITCILLEHDWREVRQRFWIMALPSLGLLLSTIYLRYHYGVDLLAAFLLFLALRQTLLKFEARKGGLTR